MSAWVNAYRFAKAATRNSPSPTDAVFTDMYLQLWLIGNSTTIEATGFGLEGLRVCNEAMSRVHPRLAACAHNEFDRDDVGRFGPLVISERGIQWRDREPLPRAKISNIEILVSGTVTFHVTRLDGIRSYCAPALKKLPNLGGLIDVAARLGYCVRRREVLTALGMIETQRAEPRRL